MYFTLLLTLFVICTQSLESAQNLQAVGYGVAFFKPVILDKLHENKGTWELSLYVLFILMCANVVFGWLSGSGEKVD